MRCTERKSYLSDLVKSFAVEDIQVRSDLLHSLDSPENVYTISASSTTRMRFVASQGGECRSAAVDILVGKLVPPEHDRYCNLNQPGVIVVSNGSTRPTTFCSGKRLFNFRLLESKP